MGKGTYAALKTSDKFEKEGVILDLGEAGKFRIARAGGANSAFQKKLMALTKPHRRALQTETIDPKVADAILRTAYAENVVLGWEDVTDEEGQPLAFTAAAAIKLFTDIPDLFQAIKETAENAVLYRQAITEADAGN